MTFDHQWTGWDGSVWNLNPGGEGVVLDNRGLIGVGSMLTDSYIRQTPALSGQRLTGVRERARDVFWPLVIDGGAGWPVLQEAFWKTMRPRLNGVWRVTDRDTNTWRELICRFVPNDTVYGNDPSIPGVEDASIDLVADDPWWHGADVVKVFQTAEDPVDFYAPPASAYVLYLMSSSTTDSASVSNPGDVDAWPVYTIAGEASSFAVTIDGGTVSGSVVVPAGGYLVVDTDPAVQTAKLTIDGVTTNVTRDLDAFDWRPIPAAGSVDLGVSLIGSGAITVTLSPRFYRAW
jgi:hypothetical protein